MNKNRFAIYINLFFAVAVLLSWFLVNNYYGDLILTWAALYQALALWGGIYGLYISKLWGLTKSLLGKAMLFFSLGLLFQAFGQTVFSIYNIVLKIETPYPSIADIGFFGSIPLYIVALYFLANAAGIRVSLSQNKLRLFWLLLPVLLFIYTYRHFLADYSFEEISFSQQFFDFAYPIGQALYVSIAVLIYALLPKNILAGVMRKRVLMLILALIFQYIADYNFLNQAYNETWVNGGYGDLLYATAYFLMGLSIFLFDRRAVNAQN